MRQVYFYDLMGTVIVRSGQDLHVKPGDVWFSVDGDRRFKVIISDRGFLPASVLLIFPASDIGAFPHHFRQILQQRQLLRRQVLIIDDLPRNIVVDIHCVGLSLETCSLDRHIFCRFKSHPVKLLQRPFEALGFRRLQLHRSADPRLRPLKGVPAEADRFCRSGRLFGSHSLIGVLDRRCPPHSHGSRRLRPGGGVLLFRRHPFLIGPPLLVREQRRPIGGIAIGTRRHHAAHQAGGGANQEIIEGVLQVLLRRCHVAAVDAGHLPFHPVPQELLQALSQRSGAQGQRSAQQTLSGVRLREAIHRLPDAPLHGIIQAAPAICFAEWQGHVEHLLREDFLRGRSRAIECLLPQGRIRIFLPRLLCGAAEGPQGKGPRPRHPQQRRNRRVDAHLREGASRIHQDLSGVAQSRLGLLRVLRRRLLQVVRHLVALLGRLLLYLLADDLCHGVILPLGLVHDPLLALQVLLAPAPRSLSVRFPHCLQVDLCPLQIVGVLLQILLILQVSPALSALIAVAQSIADGCGVALRGTLDGVLHTPPHAGEEAWPLHRSRFLPSPCAAHDREAPLPHRCAGRLRHFACLSLSAALRGRCLSVHGLDSVQAAHGVHGLYPVQPLQGVPARRGLGRFPLRGLRRSFPRVIHRPDLIQPVKYICHLLLLRRPGRPESRSALPGSASRWLRSSSACGSAPG